jgi:hypothetical protein
MKAKLFVSMMLATCLFTFNYALPSYADDQGDEQEQECHDEDGPDDGDIDGNESLEATVMLVATTNAPAGAKGVAKLEAENEDGVQTVELEIKTQGLPPGDYDLSAVRKSDSSTVDLGLITISCNGDDEDEDEDHDEDEISQTNSFSHDEEDDQDDDDEDEDHHGDCGCTNAVFRSESEVELPPDLDPMDIAQIILSDTAGNALLVGDFVNVTNGTTIKFKATIRVAPDAGAPQAQGMAVVLSSAKKGKLKKHRFTMIASGVPANSTFNVEMNGTQIGTVKSNKKGKVLVKKLPANLLNLRNVRLTDSEGHTAARAKF